MKAMVIHQCMSLEKNPAPLTLMQLPDPEPEQGRCILRVTACGICHTELDEIEGRTPPKYFPMVPGHQVVGFVEEIDNSVHSDMKKGDCVGAGWIFDSCGKCDYCRTGYENLCSNFQATGRDANGGYAEYLSIPVQSVYKIPDLFNDIQAAPLLCAGAVGFRSLRLTLLRNRMNLGLTGFGSSGHLVLQMAKHLYPDSKVMVFARSTKEQEFARSLGAIWAGDTSDTPPYPMHAIIDTTPVWRPVVEGVKHLLPGGRFVINAIRKDNSDRNELQNLQYETHLWMEREIKSVANVTRQDIQGFLALAADIPIQPKVQTYPLEQANQALSDLKKGHIQGAKVLQIES